MQLQAEIIDRKNLTPTEAKVLVELCCAEQSKGIARNLSMSIKRVDKHIDSIFEKLDIRWLSINKRSAAILIALQTGMVKVVLRSVVWVIIFQSVPFSNSDVVKTRLRRSTTTVARIREIHA